jgi:hypothetical protein
MFLLVATTAASGHMIAHTYMLVAPYEQRLVAYHLPKKLKPTERLLLLAAVLILVRERLRLDEREERLDERLLMLERLDDRDDGIPYTYDAENKFSANGQLQNEGNVTFSSLSNYLAD